jgi:hypothetical protein
VWPLIFIILGDYFNVPGHKLLLYLTGDKTEARKIKNPFKVLKQIPKSETKHSTIVETQAVNFSQVTSWWILDWINQMRSYLSLKTFKELSIYLLSIYHLSTYLPTYHLKSICLHI